MKRRDTLMRSVTAFAVASAAVLLAGCSAGDVEFNGKIFDAVGLNSQTKSAEPKLAERAPLVLPPVADQLPQPGSSDQPNGADATLAQIDDPDRKKSVSQAQLEKQQAEYCFVNYEQAKQRGDQNADLAKGPLGECRSSIFTSLQKAAKSSAE